MTEHKLGRFEERGRCAGWGCAGVFAPTGHPAGEHNVGAKVRIEVGDARGVEDNFDVPTGWWGRETAAKTQDRSYGVVVEGREHGQGVGHRQRGAGYHACGTCRCTELKRLEGIVRHSRAWRAWPFAEDEPTEHELQMQCRRIDMAGNARKMECEEGSPLGGACCTGGRAVTDKVVLEGRIIVGTAIGIEATRLRGIQREWRRLGLQRDWRKQKS